MRLLIIASLLLSISKYYSQITEYDRLYTNSFDFKMPNNDLKIGDTLPDTFFDHQKLLNSKAIGIQYPNLKLDILNSDTTYLYSIDSDITLLNFNYYYCDKCTEKLDYYMDYKNKSSKSVSVVSIFSDSKEDVNILTKKFKTREILFISNFNPSNKNYYLLNNGMPVTFVLDKNKNIIELLCFDKQEISK